MNFSEHKLPGLVKRLLRVADEENKAVQNLVNAVLEERTDDAKNLARALARQHEAPNSTTQIVGRAVGDF